MTTPTDSPITDSPDKEIVAVRMIPCTPQNGEHIDRIRLADGGELSNDDAIALMDAGKRFFMIPPPGAPAHEMHVLTGKPLLVQTRPCPSCGKRVLFA